LAGLTIAREVTRRGWSVAVLEAKRVAWNASGRNCGFVAPGFAQSLDRVVERVGRDHAKQLWALSDAGVAYVRNAIRETGMPGVKPVDGWLDVSKFDNAAAVERESALLQSFGIAVEQWPIERVRSVLRSDRYFQALHFPRAFHIHALNYALGLAAAAEQQGARIFEDTPALAIDPAGVRKRVFTPSARVRAAHVVLAGNTQLGALSTPVKGTVVPITTYVAVTKKLGDALARAIAFRGAVSDSRFADNHYRVVDGDRLMWAGGLSAWPVDPERFRQRFRDEIAHVYRQLRKVRIDQIWSGTMGFAVHRMPLIGEVSPGLWLATAFGGQGINTTAMAADLIVSAVIEGDDRWKLFLPYELVWGGGFIGRAALQLVYWSRQSRQTRRNKWMDGSRAWHDGVPEQAEPSSVTSTPISRVEPEAGSRRRSSSEEVDTR
ncbi:MAG: FAD-binding oxidoreductase, partial [Bradyrhizobiaceae bacterium]|nr:FAD-binding oxidoreductase [Bradyrhizobiaceae bacterium]